MNPKLGVVNFQKIFYIMIVIALCRILFYASLEPYKLFGDSWDYMGFSFKNMVSLKFTSGRTPVYPLILRVCLLLAGEHHFLNLVVFLQAAVSLISVFYFYKACCIVLENPEVACLVTFFYGMTPAIAGWDKVILTESFALSGTVFFLYFMLKFIDAPTFKCGFTVILLVFVLTFLRPTFLVFEVLVLCFWAARLFFEKHERKLLLKLMLCSVGVFVFITCYSYIFQQSHGIFSIADPLPRQKLLVCIERGYYRSSSNPELIKMIDTSLANNTDIWYVMTPVVEKFGKYEVNRLADECIKKNIRRYILDTVKLMGHDSEVVFYGYQQNRAPSHWYGVFFCAPVLILQNVFSVFKVAHTYVIIVAEFLLFILLWTKRKVISWIHLGIFAFMTSILITTYLGTNAEYPRTMICVLPFMYLSCAIFLNYITRDNKLHITKRI